MSECPAALGFVSFSGNGDPPSVAAAVLVWVAKAAVAFLTCIKLYTQTLVLAHDLHRNWHRNCTENPLTSPDKWFTMSMEVKAITTILLGTTMKILRAREGMTQADLAIRTDIPYMYISGLENNRIVPSDDWLNRIRDALNWDEQTNRALAMLGTKENSDAPPAGE